MAEFLKARFKVTEDHFDAFRHRTHLGVERAANRMGKRGQRVAQREMTRIRTGATRRTIRQQVVKDGQTGNVVVTVGAGTWYAHFQDRGTSQGVTPLYFLEKGLAAAVEDALGDLREELLR